jgi:hypothetical protein
MLPFHNIFIRPTPFFKGSNPKPLTSSKVLQTNEGILIGEGGLKAALSFQPV